MTLFVDCTFSFAVFMQKVAIEGNTYTVKTHKSKYKNNKSLSLHAVPKFITRVKMFHF